MAKDPYEIMGVSKKATQAEIKSAYRKLAKQYHPDLNPGKKASADKFADIGTAYALLSDKEKRKAYDSGEIDMTGQPRRQQQQYYRDFAQGNRGGRYHEPSDDFSSFNMDDILSSFFSSRNRPPADIHYRTEVDFIEAAKGTKKRISTPDGRTIELNIPAGISEGQNLRLKGKTGEPDTYVEIHIRPHPLFTRKGNDIHIELPIGIHESITGAKIEVPTLNGNVQMTLPKGADSSTTLRLKGKGINDANQYVKLKLVMPPKIDEQLEQAIIKWAEIHSYNPRKMENIT
jgi:DnaJ-class molecular chaperone